MRWVRDNTRRFERRPYYAEHEIDTHCEDIVSRFLSDVGRPSAYPMSTDDLTILIERDVSELDLYSNLSDEGRNVEGVTEFHRKKKPSVRIAGYLSAQPSRENRLRSTLAHEYGHVIFHNFLWTLDKSGPPSNAGSWRSPRCRRAKIMAAPQTDWIEWQAGYAGGALLMPVGPVRELVATSFAEWDVGRSVEFGSDHHFDLIDRVAAGFAVSRDAAGLRLLKLDYTGSPTD
jgi:hypothetical protein